MIDGHDPLKWLQQKAKAGTHGYPAGTVAFYGADARRASKVVAAVLLLPDHQPAERRAWTSETSDLRRDSVVLRRIVDLFRFYGIRSLAMPLRIVGCPHEAGTDFPQGQVCPQCPYWIGRDRWDSPPST